MKAGRELDALVAEKVMGCTVYVEANGNPRCDCTGPNAAGPRPHAGVGLYASLHRYSTDVGSAWEVVEKMEADGWWYAVESLTTGKYGARFGRRGGKDFLANADTVPLAICKAALFALGVEVE